MSTLYLANHIVVSVFGMVLSAAFCNIVWTRRRRLVMAGSMAALLVFQGMIYFFIAPETVGCLYPLTVHLPLAVVLCILSRECVWPVISVLTAYLCCQLRRWLALLIVAICSGSSVVQSAAELAVTLPILLVLLRAAASPVRSVSHFTVSVQCQFGLVPALYYGFDYLTRIYTDLLLEGVLVAVEFMPFVCSVAYLVFIVYTSQEAQRRSRIEQRQDILNLQIAQAVREIRTLREVQKKTNACRHDLRHHMQYLSACIENGCLEQAQRYIREVCTEIEAGRVTVFCENEAVNLIFSAFAGQIAECGIPIEIWARIPRTIPIAESDLCVLLSNALENALHACRNVQERGGAAAIAVSAYEKNGKFFLQIINSCDGEVTFERGIPVTDRKGHGIGVHSICAIVEQYGGACTFSVKEGQFIFRASL